MGGQIGTYKTRNILNINYLHFTQNQEYRKGAAKALQGSC